MRLADRLLEVLGRRTSRLRSRQAYAVLAVLVETRRRPAVRSRSS